MALIPVTLAGRSGNPTYPVAGEPVCEGLAITPEVRAYGDEDVAQFSGAWHLTHTLSGLAYTRWAVCISCIRHIARIATESGVDWTQGKATLVADEAARAVAQRSNEMALNCTTDTNGCGGADDEPTL